MVMDALSWLVKLIDRSLDNGVGTPKICGHDSCGLVVCWSRCSIVSSETCGCGQKLDSLCGCGRKLQIKLFSLKQKTNNPRDRDRFHPNYL